MNDRPYALNDESKALIDSISTTWAEHAAIVKANNAKAQLTGRNDPELVLKMRQKMEEIERLQALLEAHKM